MAGNLPLVGFHDVVCVLLSGHRVVIKLSSKDKSLIPAFIDILESKFPEINDRVQFVSDQLGSVDKVIAQEVTTAVVISPNIIMIFHTSFEKTETV